MTVRRLLRWLGWALLGLLMTPVLLLGGAFAAEWYLARDAYTYAWDATVENTTGQVTHSYRRDGKHRGVSLVGLDSVAFAPLIMNNVEWIAVMPFGWQQTPTTPHISRDPAEAEPWAPSDASLERTIRHARQRGLRVLLKPHLWLTASRAWRAEIAMPDEAAWQQWFASYEAFLLHYATMAERLGVELLCIGTELHASVAQRPDDWRQLIAAVRAVYSGQLTYAANWDGEFEAVTFWDALDFIGVQAYFPLSEAAQPTAPELVAGWQPHVARLREVQEKYQRPVLFTEVGYRSAEQATAQPWAWEGLGTWAAASALTQAAAYEALFEVFWDEPWFAGAYLWRWQGRHPPPGLLAARAFTPQHKPAQNIMARWFHPRQAATDTPR